MPRNHRRTAAQRTTLRRYEGPDLTLVLGSRSQDVILQHALGDLLYSVRRLLGGAGRSLEHGLILGGDAWLGA